MSRPTDLEPDFIASCDEEIERYRNTGPDPTIRGMLADPLMREIWYAGAWLGRKLRDELGLGEPEWRKICFNHGRLCYGAACPWTVAKTMLASERSRRQPALWQINFRVVMREGGCLHWEHVVGYEPNASDIVRFKWIAGFDRFPDDLVSVVVKRLPVPEGG